MNRRVALIGALVLLLFAVASCAGYTAHKYYDYPYGYGNSYDGPNYYGFPD